MNQLISEPVGEATCLLRANSEQLEELCEKRKAKEWRVKLFVYIE